MSFHITRIELERLEKLNQIAKHIEEQIKDFQVVAKHERKLAEENEKWLDEMLEKQIKESVE